MASTSATLRISGKLRTLVLCRLGLWRLMRPVRSSGSMNRISACWSMRFMPQNVESITTIARLYDYYVK